MVSCGARRVRGAKGSLGEFWCRQGEGNLGEKVERREIYGLGGLAERNPPVRLDKISCTKKKS